ncbi:MAG TPA: diguanylate cyclase [Solirubrobacteraceae bacterium]|jgi:diguanylate cyclase (GGDEF)-like protein/PAS domain S-box-containing protein|nr:diguanylate cyclase [Solirubrobacteraceae bacterium]
MSTEPQNEQISEQTELERPKNEPDELRGGIFDSAGDLHSDADSLEKGLRSLLAVYPRAPVGAMTSAGIYVSMPDSIELSDEHQVLEGRSGLDLISEEDRVVVLANWDRALKFGASRCAIHPQGYDEVILYALDLRERHGIVFTLLASSNPLAAAEPVEVDTTAQRPRFATIHKDELSFLVHIDEAITQILGWEPEDMLGHRSLEFVHQDDHALAIDNWMQMLARPGPARRVRQRLSTKDGNWVWFEVTNHNLLGDPDQKVVVCEMVDITEEMAANEDLRAREQLLDRLAETVPVGLMQLDDEMQIVYTNDRLHEILGTDRAETVSQQLANVDPEDRLAIEAALAALMSDGADAEVEVAVTGRQDGRDRNCQISLRALTHEGGEVSGAIACLADVSDSIAMREELRRRATHDDLTGCLNRAAITRALEENIAGGDPDGHRALLFIDLDGFKEVNDQHGHAAGDELLRAVAGHLRGSVRSDDLVGRLGGDEFLVLCPYMDEDNARRLADRLTISAAAGAIGSEADVTASVGVAWSRGAEIDAETLLANADRAMYEAKRERSRARREVAERA